MQTIQAYPSSLIDEQWNDIEDLVPKFAGFGRPPEHSRRHIVNAIFYIVRSGCAWRLLPHDFAPWQTVYGYFRRWKIQGVWEMIHDTLVLSIRLAAGKKTNPTAAMVDSQSVKIADQAGDRGYDAGKKIKGRKRHVLVDTLGMILLLHVTAADVQDRDGAKGLLKGLKHTFSRLRLIWADGGYAGSLVEWVCRLREQRRVHLDIVKRSAGQRGFHVLRKRWIVERTFGWLMKSRRLRCDYEQLTATSEAMIRIAMIRLMLKRLHT